MSGAELTRTSGTLATGLAPSGKFFIEDDHVSTRGFAGACHFNGPIAYETFYPLNPTDEQLAEAREKAERYTKKAAALLANN